MVYYLFGFAALYLFWGVGVAGVGMKVIVETDWEAERMREKASRLLRYAPVIKVVQRKRLLGRGKVLSSMPFNVFEGVGIIFRLKWLRKITVYLFAVPVVFGWTIGLVCIYLFRRICAFFNLVGEKIMDQEEDDDEMDCGAIRSETERLLPRSETSEES
jgi:hypothetical protein